MYSDITPVQLNDKPQLCQIVYDDEYKETMGTVLALMKLGELSERALALTEKGIELLASHYTLWIYRFDILKHLNKDLVQELAWCEQIAMDNPKNYQIWNYRQLVVEELANDFDPHKEYPIINAMLEDDAKNHHVWSYRKWLVSRFDLHEDPAEIAFVDSCLRQDLRNNSAWAHRFFLRFSKSPSVDIVSEEIAYAQQAISSSPQNPSAWNYLVGVYDKMGRDLAELTEFCEGFVEGKVTSSYALEVLGGVYKGEKARGVYELLCEYDPIRRAYWDYKVSNSSDSEGEKKSLT